MGSSLLAAAMLLPLVATVQAEVQPEQGLVAFKYLNYRDSQPGRDRIQVTTPVLSVMAPVGKSWSFSATKVVDSISGASPAYHTEALKKMVDQRHGFDASVTRYDPHGTLTVGFNQSVESDYKSDGLFLAGTRSSDDKNTTWNAALNVSHDKIYPSNGIVTDETKEVVELSLGITQVLTHIDIVQAILAYSRGSGYFSDPYKVFDNRPRERNHSTLLLRWNHHWEPIEATLRLSYRYYTDSYGIKAHTVAAEHVQPLGSGWQVIPSLRLYTQTAARFYVDRDPDAAPFVTNPPEGAIYFSEDQRLSSYGAHAVGLKLVKQLDRQWTLDFKAERYEQQNGWSLSGGSPYLEPFSATSYQLGVSRSF